MTELPGGTVTFLFTDLEGSTRLWEEQPDAMRVGLARHDELLREVIESRHGHVVKTTGDGVYAVFGTGSDAVDAALAAQLALQGEAWAATGPLRVRIGMHTGAAELRGDDYHGTAVNKAARVMGVANGGQVLLSAATAELVRDGLSQGVGLIDLGEHRLRDLSRAERLFQLVHPGLPRDFGRLRTVDAYPGNLPSQLSSLIGREDELERVADALARSAVVTLTGVGGVGKTRLALQVAAELVPRFRDGAWLCELQMVRDPAAVADAVAAVFRVSARTGATVEDSLTSYLREQELLVVLDNCEHLLRPVASLVAKVVAACPGVRVLATSREGLNLRSEQILVVPSLGVPEEGMDHGAVAACEAVRLFADRARALRADFAVEAANADALSQVCRRLDGVPLAIELAAARIGAMNPSELARRLDRRFRLLTGGERVAIERHQTLRATIDWSYDLLSEPQQRLLARLAVFAGGCTLEAAEAVCAAEPIEGDDVLELLARLVACSLVVADDAGPDTRYRLLETIRQYGEERLAERGETDALRLRHGAYYREFAAVVRAQIYGLGQVEWGARLARERDNLLVAMARALDSRNVDLAFGLFCQLPAIGPAQINELVAFDPEPLLALPGAADHPGYANALVAAAFRAWGRGDATLALALCDQALAAERRLGPAGGLPVDISASALRGQIAQAAGATDEAVERILDAARRAREAGLPAFAAVELGAVAQALAWSDPAAAQRHASEGLVLARQTGMPHAIAYNLLGLGMALATTEPDQARSVLAEALKLGATLGYESFNEVTSVVFAAALVGDWPVVLRAAGRELHHRIRSGLVQLVTLTATLNFIARGLAQDEPEPAAVLQGAVTAVLRQLAPDIAASVGGSAGQTRTNNVAPFVAGVRRETTELLTASLGTERLRDLRAQGAAMTEAQIMTFARAQIAEYLAHARPARS
jgi:predicted ATPase/class 3 adenylate cyclase